MCKANWSSRLTQIMLNDVFLTELRLAAQRSVMAYEFIITLTIHIARKLTPPVNQYRSRKSSSLSWSLIHYMRLKLDTF